MAKMYNQDIRPPEDDVKPGTVGAGPAFGTGPGVFAGGLGGFRAAIHALTIPQRAGIETMTI
jgi:hypothetical protein